jgi:hypothetical protein
MAGLVPAIHVFTHSAKNVEARDKPGHDGVCECKFGRPTPSEAVATAFRAIPLFVALPGLVKKPKHSRDISAKCALNLP